MTQDAGFTGWKEGPYVIMRLEKVHSSRVSNMPELGVRPEGVAEMVSMSSVHSICNNHLVIVKFLRLTGGADDCSPTASNRTEPQSRAPVHSQPAAGQ